MQALMPYCLECELNKMQQRILSEGLPVLIIFEGSSGRAIGRVIKEFMRCLEPRGVVYTHFDPVEKDTPRSMMDFLQRTPGKGQIGLFDRSWYSLMIERYHKAKDHEDLDRMIEVSNGFERYLTLNGVLVIKIFLRATDSAIVKFGVQYGPRTPKVSFLSMDHINPSKYKQIMFGQQLYDRTNTEWAPWNKIMVRDIGETFLESAETIMRIVNEKLNAVPSVSAPREINCKYHNPRKDAVFEGTCEHYETIMNDLSEQLGVLQMDLSLSDRSMIVCFEGWDASGKGSCIKHLCHALNPRGYSVYQTKAPSQEELNHTYLWRFVAGIPKKGHITVFDRTWYGRMMVEHIEGFCTDEEYGRSPIEINALEKMIVNDNTILIKFWLDITPDEQKKRFKKRMNDPLKQWKITDEDWRNRAKWKEYDSHVDTMICSTNTEIAPWIVIDANSKKHARIAVLQTVAESLKKELNK